MPKVSVIICTHNRSKNLSECISALLSQTYKNYEIIVVDNASCDNTKEVINELKAKSPIVKYIYEPLLGLSHARNTGLNAAKGDIVIFIDDDELASSQFIEGHVICYENKDAVATGGMIDLKWLCDIPKWLPASFYGRLGKLDLGDDVCEFRFPEYPFGGNMSFRKDFLNKIGGFSTNLGIKGKRKVSNEEKEIFTKISKMGSSYKIIYSPISLVLHKINSSQIKFSNFINRLYMQGISDVILLWNEEVHHQKKFWFFKAFKSFLKSIIFLIKGFMLKLTSNKKLSFCDLTQAAYLLGYSKECLKIFLISKK